MKTAAIIQARMGSTRLPNKVLMPVMGKPLLGWMHDRVSICPEVNEVIIATTNDQRDDVIAAFAQSVGCKLYRGSEEDVLDRYYRAASMVMPDAVARITADCPLLDPNVLSRMIREFAAGGLDFISNSEPLPSTWPDGMDISIIGFEALKNAWHNAVKPSDREHVTFYFWNNPQIFRCKRIEHEQDWSNYRLTIDYPEDFEVLRAIIMHFGLNDPTRISLISMEEIIAYLKVNSTIFNLNKKYSRGLGWLPALQRDRELGL